MAEGYLKRFCGPEAEVFSAGIEAHGLNPRALKVMKEDGLDISSQSSDTIDRFADMNFDFIITVCDNARENCPYLPGKATRLHHNFPDPAKAVGTEEQVMTNFRNVRDQVKQWCINFVKENL
jgi:arsenate reductase (thioredoxin)